MSILLSTRSSLNPHGNSIGAVCKLYTTIGTCSCSSCFYTIYPRPWSAKSNPRRRSLSHYSFNSNIRIYTFCTFSRSTIVIRIHHTTINTPQNIFPNIRSIPPNRLLTFLLGCFRTKCISIILPILET